MLRILLTTVHVESSFSTYKATRDEQQWSMDSDTHICKMSYAFNGVVPLGKDLIAPMVLDNSTKRPPVRRAGAVFNAEDCVDVVDPATSAGSDRRVAQPAEGSRRAKKDKVVRPPSSQADEPPVAQIPASPSQQRVDVPTAEQIPAQKKRKMNEAACRDDQSERTLTTAVNADDPNEQLGDYDVFV